MIEARTGSRFLDLACGTGNYANALASLGGSWFGCDISDVMIDQARAKNCEIDWKLGNADVLPYQSAFFDGGICVLAIHHFPDLLQTFQEVHRVLNQGAFVLFTAFPEQMQDYWLCHYFPEMMRSSTKQMPAQNLVTGALKSAGFEVEDVVPFQVTSELLDLFLYSGKARPNLYLDSAVRANISSFASRCSSAELNCGLQQLSSDIESGEFLKVASRYPSTHGDYAFVVARKHRR